MMNENEFKKQLKQKLESPEPSDRVLHMIKTAAEHHQPKKQKPNIFALGLRYAMVAAVIVLIGLRFYNPDSGIDMLQQHDLAIAELTELTEINDALAQTDNMNMNRTDDVSEMLEISASIDLLLND